MSRVLIDGYNLLSLSLHRDRDGLVRSLSQYKRSKGHSITIVFDGTYRGTNFGDRYFEAGIEVLFSPIDITADDVIEELLEKPDAAGWIVISSDRRIQNAAFRAHASYLSSEEFLIKLRESKKQSRPNDLPPWAEGREDEWFAVPQETHKLKLTKKEKQRKKRTEKL